MKKSGDEELAYVRLNVLLPEDALKKLDVIKETIGLASRGRTIQTLIERVWDVQYDLQRIIDKAKNKGDNSDYLSAIRPHFFNLIRQLSFVFYTPKAAKEEEKRRKLRAAG